MIMRRFVAYLPKLIASVLRDYGQYNRQLPAINFIVGGLDNRLVRQSLSMVGSEIVWNIEVTELNASVLDRLNWISADDDNNLYVLDSEGNCTKVNYSGNEVWRYNDGIESYSYLMGLAVSSDQEVFVGQPTGKVLKLNPNGEFSWVYEFSGNKKIRAIQLDNDGNIYVLYYDEWGTWGDHITKLNPDGSFNKDIRADVWPGFIIDWDQPGYRVQMYLDKVNGKIYVGGVDSTDSGSKEPAYRVFDLDLDLIRQANLDYQSGGSEQVFDIFTDEDENVFVTIGYNTEGEPNIFKMTDEGVEMWRNAAVLGERLTRITPGPDGNIYASCWNTDRIIRFDSEGVRDDGWSLEPGIEDIVDLIVR